MATTSISSYEPAAKARSYFCCINRERAGKALHLLALQLFRPLHWTSLVVGRLVTPISSKQHRNHPNKNCELASRTTSVVGALLFSPVTLATAITGGMVQSVGIAISPHPYYYIRGKAPVKQEEARLFTLNPCMFWGGIPMLVGGVFPADDRMQALVALILRVNPTVFVAQEVAFGPGLKLAKALEPYYTHIFLNIGASPLQIQSGLFVAIRCHTVGMPYFKAFPNQHSIRRGIFCFETDSFSVITSHLESGDAYASAPKIRKVQFDVITQEARVLLKSGKPCFLLGDLNCSREEIPPRFFDPYKEKYPVVNEKTATCTSALTPWMRGKSPSPEKNPWELDDYILVAATKSLPEMQTELVRTFDLNKPHKALSDHHGLLLTAHNL